MDFWNGLLQILIDAGMMTLRLLPGLFGGLFVFGLLLYLSARFTRNVFAKTFGPRAEIYITAWAGTPVHELGHAFFCLIFGHKITKISLFKPNSKEGTIGFVQHSYDKKNLYHQVGNFFIGAGPLIFGSLSIVFLLWLLVPGGSIVLSNLRQAGMTITGQVPGMGEIFQVFGLSVKSFVSQLFTSENLHSWRFWVFLYLAMAISAHAELSPPDISAMLKGFFVIMSLFFLINLIYVIFWPATQSFLFYGIRFFDLLVPVLFVAFLFSLFYFLLAFIVATLVSLVRNGEMVNPFTR